MYSDIPGLNMQLKNVNIILQITTSIKLSFLLKFEDLIIAYGFTLCFASKYPYRDSREHL